MGLTFDVGRLTKVVRSFDKWLQQKTKMLDSLYISANKAMKSTDRQSPFYQNSAKLASKAIRLKNSIKAQAETIKTLNTAPPGMMGLMLDTVIWALYDADRPFSATKYRDDFKKLNSDYNKSLETIGSAMGLPSGDVKKAIRSAYNQFIIANATTPDPLDISDIGIWHKSLREHLLGAGGNIDPTNPDASNLNIREIFTLFTKGKDKDTLQQSLGIQASPEEFLNTFASYCISALRKASKDSHQYVGEKDKEKEAFFIEWSETFQRAISSVKTANANIRIITAGIFSNITTPDGISQYIEAFDPKSPQKFNQDTIQILGDLTAFTSNDKVERAQKYSAWVSKTTDEIETAFAEITALLNQLNANLENDSTRQEASQDPENQIDSLETAANVFSFTRLKK